MKSYRTVLCRYIGPYRRGGSSAGFPGETVLAGMVNGSGLLENQGHQRIRRDVSGPDSRPGGERCQPQGADGEDNHQIVPVHTPAVVLAAALVAVVPPLVLSNAAFRDWSTGHWCCWSSPARAHW